MDTGYEVEGYTEEIFHDFEGRLDTIFGRQVNRVHILDFKGLTEEMRETLTSRLRMLYTRTEGQGLIGLTVIARELLVIDMDELVRLRFCDRMGDTCAWVASGPKRQPVAAVVAPRVLRVPLLLMRVSRLFW
ncbi:hypothetical protein Tco_1574025, partial [Tanacetum coccineum]